jgi:hypothetical protein
MSEQLIPHASVEQVERLLGVHRGASLHEVTEATARYRGRTIVVRDSQHLNGTEICGLWLSGGEVDQIFHATTRYETYRTQIVLHELAHMLLRHDELAPADSQMAAMFPDLPVGRLLTRSSFRLEIEEDAERLAYTLAQVVEGRPRSVSGFGEAFE